MAIFSAFHGMKKSLLFLFLVILLKNVSQAQSYGLTFASHEVMQEKRTSLNLTPTDPWKVKQPTDLAFDLNFIPFRETYFGYVVRLIFTNNENIDLVYNEITLQFNFLVGEHLAAAFSIDSLQLYRNWNHIRIRLSPENGTAAIYYNDKLMGSGKGRLDGTSSCRIFFGTNNFEGYQTVDIPPMNLRNVSIAENDKLEYCWPLAESEGVNVTDTLQDKRGLVSNPGWIRPKHQNWQQAEVIHVKGRASVAFDRSKELLYIVSADSLHQYSFRDMALCVKPLAAHHDTLLGGNQSVFDPFQKKLYNFYIDEKKVATYDTTTRKWDQHFNAIGLTYYWQANKFVGADSALYVIGGYGYLAYKNGVQRYDLRTKTWDSLPVKGDRFMPRYLAALGSNAAGDTAFIMGGYGSNTGNQVMNPKHYYDLVAYSVRDRSFRSIYHFKEPEEQFCFANSLVVMPGSQEYYALVYPNDKFNTSLQLINGSLRTPGYRLLANTIPYSFHDIQSFADLYYCADSKQLVAVTMYLSKKDDVSEIKIYTIAFPPNELVVQENVAYKIGKWYYWLLLPIAAVVLYFVGRRRRRGDAANGQAVISGNNGSASPAPAPHHVNHVHASTLVINEQADNRAHVYFFGQFEACDPEGKDVTRLFTPLLKELFLIITIYTLRSGKGISAERLYATLWRDKSSKEAQNNRSVNMVKLKAILDKLGSCNFVKEADRWSMHYDKEQIDIDLAGFLQFVHAPKPLSQEQVAGLLCIVRRGPLLADTELHWLEDIQSEVADMAISLLSDAILQFQQDPEFLIEIANGIFLFDPVNEEALRIKCKSLGILGRHSIAKATFDKFAKEYQHMYGEDFQHTFHEVFS